MHKIITAIVTAVGAAAVAFGTFAAAGDAQGQQVAPAPHPNVGYTQGDGSSPAQPLDCVGTTGGMGCGPGWFWRDGWRGWGCYPC
jgi:hypothetical protein